MQAMVTLCSLSPPRRLWEKLAHQGRTTIIRQVCQDGFYILPPYGQWGHRTNLPLGKIFINYGLTLYTPREQNDRKLYVMEEEIPL